MKWKLLGQFPNDQQMGLNVSSILFYFTRNRKYSTKSVTVGLHFSLFKACQPLANSSIFSGEAGCFRTESAFYHWSAVFSLHFTPGVQSTVCVLRWLVSNILNAGRKFFQNFHRRVLSNLLRINVALPRATVATAFQTLCFIIIILSVFLKPLKLVLAFHTKK